MADSRDREKMNDRGSKAVDATFFDQRGWDFITAGRRVFEVLNDSRYFRRLYRLKSI